MSPFTNHVGLGLFGIVFPENSSITLRTYLAKSGWFFNHYPRLSIVPLPKRDPQGQCPWHHLLSPQSHRIVKDVQGTEKRRNRGCQSTTVHQNISCQIMPYTHTHVWMMFDVCEYKDIHLRYLGLDTTPNKKTKIFTQLWICFPILFSPRVVTLQSSDPALPLACQCRRWPPQAGWNSENPSDFGDCGAALSFSLSETHHFWSSHFNMQNTSDHYHDRLEKHKVQVKIHRLLLHKNMNQSYAIYIFFIIFLELYNDIHHKGERPSNQVDHFRRSLQKHPETPTSKGLRSLLSLPLANATLLHAEYCPKPTLLKEENGLDQNSGHEHVHVCIYIYIFIQKIYAKYQYMIFDMYMCAYIPLRNG